MVVDELSLIQTGPVGVKLYCRDSCTLRGFVRIFFNRVGYQIKFVSEKYKDKSSYQPPPSDKRNDYDDEEQGEGEDLEEGSDRKHKRRTGKGHEEKGQPQGSGGKNTQQKTHTLEDEYIPSDTEQQGQQMDKIQEKSKEVHEASGPMGHDLSGEQLEYLEWEQEGPSTEMDMM
jgi:hypothetical protein